MKKAMKKTHNFKKILLVIVFVFGIFSLDFFVFQKFAKASATLQTLRPSSNSLGLVAFWSFDGTDIVNGRVIDRSGNANNGTPTSIATTTFYTIGKTGQSVFFDGVDDTISVPDNIVLDNTSQLTISMWVKPALLDGQPRGIISKRTGPSTEYSYSMFFHTNSKLYVDIADSTERFSSNTVFKDNRWYHIVLVYDGTLASAQRAKLFVDGVLDVTSTESSSSITDTSSNLVLGFLTAGSAYFKGGIDDTRIYNRALSTSEVNRLYNSGGGKQNNSQNLKMANGLIGMWSFDGADVVNGMVIDRSPTVAHGTPIDIATSTFYTVGKIGQGVTLDGVDDCVRMGDISTYDFDASTSFTVSGWYKRMNNSNTGMFVTKKGSSVNTTAGFYYNIITTNGGIIEARVSDGTNQVVHSSGTVNGINDGRWHYLAIVVDRSAQTINSYVDGVAETASSISSVGSLSTTSHFALGARSSTGTCSTPTPISLDDVRVYNRALSSTEIQQLYNLGGGKQNASPKNSLKNGLLAGFTFDGPDVLTGRINDFSGNGNHGTTLNIASSTFYTIGKFGQGVRFDGLNDRVDFSGISLGTSYTASMWIRPTAGGDTGFATLYSDSGATSGLWIRKSTMRLNLYYSSTDHFNSTTLTVNQWTHIAVVNNSGTATFYLNGIADGTAASAPALTVRYTGSDSSGEDYLGNTDELRFYNRALSAMEVRQLYELGR